MYVLYLFLKQSKAVSIPLQRQREWRERLCTEGFTTGVVVLVLDQWLKGGNPVDSEQLLRTV